MPNLSRGGGSNSGDDSPDGEEPQVIEVQDQELGAPSRNSKNYHSEIRSKSLANDRILHNDGNDVLRQSALEAATGKPVPTRKSAFNRNPRSGALSAQDLL